MLNVVGLLHYLHSGKSEGRFPISQIDKIKFPEVILDPTKEVIIIGIHEASRTGAPILGWNMIVQLKKLYNVIVILKKRRRN